MWRSLAALATVASVLAGGPRTAAGFAVSESEDGVPLRWPDGTVRYHIDPSGGMPVSVEHFVPALDAAFAHWSAVDASPLDLVAGAPAPGGLGFDEHGTNASVVRWATSAWDHDPEALALTFVHYRADDGRILDADILVNAVDHAWTASEAEARSDPTRHDVQSTLTHEAGHFLGLAHSLDHPDAVMFPTAAAAEVKRTLADDDAAGFRFLYLETGAPPTPGTTPSTPGDPVTAPATGAPRGLVGCSAAPAERAAGGSALFAGAALALALWVGRTRVRRGRGLRGAAAAPSCGRARRAGVSRRAGPVGLALLLLGAAPAEAAVLRYLAVADLAARADVVVHGRVLAVQARRAGAWIVTESTVGVVRCLRGPCRATVTVSQLGGEIDGVGLRVEGTFRARPGEEVVLFLRRGRGGVLAPVGMVQGALRVERAAGRALSAIRDLRGQSLVRDGAVVAGAREALRLDALVALVRRR